MALLAPFADLDGFDPPPARSGDGPVELITVAMMLKGAKMESWRLLADAVRRLKPDGWRLLLVGDGPLRGEVEKLFSGIGQVRFAGQVDRQSVAGLLARSDVFVWPGWRISSRPDCASQTCTAGRRLPVRMRRPSAVQRME